MTKARNLLGVFLLVNLAFFPAHVLSEEKLNINTASVEELMKLPEMTEARAKAIIVYRKGHGELIQLEELELIPQVDPIYDQIKDRLVLE